MLHSLNYTYLQTMDFVTTGYMITPIHLWIFSSQVDISQYREALYLIHVYLTLPNLNNKKYSFYSYFCHGTLAIHVLYCVCTTPS